MVFWIQNQRIEDMTKDMCICVTSWLCIHNLPKIKCKSKGYLHDSITKFKILLQYITNV